jgi:hypothetical protein
MLEPKGVAVKQKPGQSSFAGCSVPDALVTPLQIPSQDNATLMPPGAP